MDEQISIKITIISDNSEILKQAMLSIQNRIQNSQNYINLRESSRNIPSNITFEYDLFESVLNKGDKLRVKIYVKKLTRSSSLIPDQNDSNIDVLLCFFSKYATKIVQTMQNHYKYYINKAKQVYYVFMQTKDQYEREIFQTIIPVNTLKYGIGYLYTEPEKSNGAEFFNTVLDAARRIKFIHDDNNVYPFQKAILSEDFAKASALVDKELVHETINSGDNALHLLCKTDVESENLDFVEKYAKYLINSGLNVCDKNKNDETPFIIAVKYNQMLVKFFLEMPNLKDFINIPDNCKLTPLMHSAKQYSSIFDDILKKSDFNLCDIYGQNVLFYMADISGISDSLIGPYTKSLTTLLELMKSAIKVQSKTGETALHKFIYSIMNANSKIDEIINVLFGRVDYDSLIIEDFNKFSPLDILAQKVNEHNCETANKIIGRLWESKRINKEKLSKNKFYHTIFKCNSPITSLISSIFNKFGTKDKKKESLFNDALENCTNIENFQVIQHKIKKLPDDCFLHLAKNPIISEYLINNETDLKKYLNFKDNTKRFNSFITLIKYKNHPLIQYYMKTENKSDLFAQSKDESQNTILHSIILFDSDYELCKLFMNFLEIPKSFLEKNKDGMNPLELLISAVPLKIPYLRLLVEKIVSSFKDVEEYHKRTIINDFERIYQIAIHQNNTPLVVYIYYQLYKIGCATKFGESYDTIFSVLHYAIDSNDKTIIDQWLTVPWYNEKGDDFFFSCITSISYQSFTPLQMAFEKNIQYAVEKMLPYMYKTHQLQYNDAPCIHKYTGFTYLIYSILSGNEKAIKEFTASKYNLYNVCDNNGWYPIHHAVNCGNKTAITLLMEYHNQLSLETYDGWYPIHIAAMNGNLEIIKHIKKYATYQDLCINKSVTYHCEQMTPIGVAFHFGHYNIIRYFLDISPQRSMEQFLQDEPKKDEILNVLG